MKKKTQAELQAAKKEALQVMKEAKQKITDMQVAKAYLNNQNARLIGAGLTQQELAESLGISHATLYRRMTSSGFWKHVNRMIDETRRDDAYIKAQMEILQIFMETLRDPNTPVMIKHEMFQTAGEYGLFGQRAETLASMSGITADGMGGPVNNGTIINVANWDMEQLEQAGDEILRTNRQINMGKTKKGKK